MKTFHLVLKVKCEECEKLFSRNDINNRMKLVHTYETYTCPFCDTLKTKFYLAKHIKSNHKAFQISNEEAITVGI